VTPEELKEIVEKGESETLELKTSTAELKEAVISIGVSLAVWGHCERSEAISTLLLMKSEIAAPFGLAMTMTTSKR